jgi:hypothetical protein
MGSVCKESFSHFCSRFKQLTVLWILHLSRYSYQECAGPAFLFNASKVWRNISKSPLSSDICRFASS